jgi:hypothetical protein
LRKGRLPDSRASDHRNRGPHQTQWSSRSVRRRVPHPNICLSEMVSACKPLEAQACTSQRQGDVIHTVEHLYSCNVPEEGSRGPTSCSGGTAGIPLRTREQAIIRRQGRQRIDVQPHVCSPTGFGVVLGAPERVFWLHAVGS